jgi:predicted secreted protein
MIRCDAPGTDPGAPIKSQTGRKLIWTTIISAVIFALAMMEYRAADEAEKLMGIPL